MIQPFRSLRWLRPITGRLALLVPLLFLVASVHPGESSSPDRWEKASSATAVSPTVTTDLNAVNAEEVLWLARCIYSETKRTHEQKLVAWVVRNRVETRYRGQASYQGTVLDPYQFSAFNPESRTRRHYMTLQPDDKAPGWQRAQEIAREVYTADASERPFPIETRHFYSERSMQGRLAPAWSAGERPVKPVGFRVDPRRFRFFSRIGMALSIQ